jgi:hypothetical protein
MNVTHKKTPWWEGFELFISVKHPTLYKKYVLCKECSTFRKNPDAGIVKVGVSQSTSNLWAHMHPHHPAKYETIAKHVDKITQKLIEVGVLPTSIARMPGFSAMLNVQDARLLYRTAASLNLHSIVCLSLLIQNPTRLSSLLAKKSELQYLKWVDLQLRQQRGRSAITKLCGLLITERALTRGPILLLQHIGSTIQHGRCILHA